MESTPEETKFCLRIPFTTPTEPRPSIIQTPEMECANSPIVKDVTEPKKHKKKRQKAPKVIHSVLPGKTILVVDDNPLIVRVLEKILDGCRHLQTAFNGQEALRIVIERMRGGEEFDLIFMDCLMPVMDGYTATRMMRQLGYRGPILALTGNSSEADAEKAKDAGYNSTVVKPIRTDDLISIIQTWTNPKISPSQIGLPDHMSSSSPHSSSPSLDSSPNHDSLTPIHPIEKNRRPSKSLMIFRDHTEEVSAHSQLLKEEGNIGETLRTLSITEPYQMSGCYPEPNVTTEMNGNESGHLSMKKKKSKRKSPTHEAKMGLIDMFKTKK